MGQQQQEIAVAGSAAVRRLVLVLLVAALMAAMLAVSTMPASARALGHGDCIKGHQDALSGKALAQQCNGNVPD
jgi:hypothetical protein